MGEYKTKAAARRGALRYLAAMTAIVLGSSHVTAGGSGIVFDPTNYIQNLATAGATVKTLAQQVQQVQLQYQQVQALIKAGKSLDPRAIAANALLTDSDAQAAARVLIAADDMRGDIASLRASMTKRVDAAMVMKRPWQDYVKDELAAIKRRENAALARVQTEQHAMKNIEKQYEFIRREGAKIAGTAGVHESMQQMNLQMNQLLAQQAEFMRITALAQGSQAAEAQMRDAEDKAKQLAKEQAMQAESERLRRSMKQDEDGALAFVRNRSTK